MSAQRTEPTIDEQVETYRRDGVVCLRGLLDQAWIDLLRDNVERYLAGPSGVANDAAGGAGGRFQLDYQMWTIDPDQRRFVFESPLGEVAAKMMGSSAAYLTVDLMLVKEPHTPVPTPWHTDTLYGWYEGDQMVSMWVGLDPVTKESGAVEFVRGSHRWGRQFVPAAFSGGDLPVEGAETVPDIDADRDAYDIVHFDTQPGDVIVNNLGTLHAAPGNATERRRRAIAFRFGGDDCRYVERPGSMRPIRDPGIRPGDPIGCDLFPRVWPRAA
jgi:ectoine hydroxylase-related dioxygenase (phytanoyl-CoA dioxygenase family)